MNFLEQLLKRSEEQARLDSFSSKTFHSSYYHDQYQGYSERYVLDENGKKRIQRVYTGPYYRPLLSEKRRRLIAPLRAALLLAGTAFFLFGASRTTACNTVVYVTLGQALSVLCLFWTLLGVLNGFLRPGDLKVGDYTRTVARVRRASLYGALCLYAVTLAAVIAALRSAAGFDADAVLAAASFFLAGVFLLGLNRMEAGIEYQVIDNPMPEPEGSIQI